MLKSALIVGAILSVILFKFDFFFKDLLMEKNWLLLMLIVSVLFIVIIYKSAYDIFFATGPLYKFGFYFVTTSYIVTFAFTPFNNMQEFLIRFTLVSIIMLVPIYCIIKKVSKMNDLNYSIVDALNEKFLMILKNNLCISWVAVGFVFLVSISQGLFNYTVMSVFIYFSILVILSLWSKFNLEHNGFTHVVTLVILSGYVLSTFGYNIPENYFIAAALIYVGLTIYDVIALVKYIKNPEKFLSDWRDNMFMVTLFSSVPYNTIDYFKYFKHVQLGKTFIHYDSLFGSLRCVMTDDYYIRKQFNYSSKPIDKLFHFVEKDVQQSRFIAILELSQRYLDEHTNIDKYAMFHFSTIQNYMITNHIEYSDLTDDDLKVIEMSQY